MDIESVIWHLQIGGHNYGSIAMVALQHDLSLEGAMRHIMEKKQEEDEFIASLSEVERQTWYPNRS